MTISRKEQAQARTISDLNALYAKHYPKNPVFKRDAWVKNIILARERKK